MKYPIRQILTKDSNKKSLDGSIFGWLFVRQDAELRHYDGGSWFGGGGIGIRYCMIYFARKLGRFDGGSCYGGGCIGIRYCFIYLARKL